MSDSNHLSHVAIFGASGNIGSHITRGLLQQPNGPSTITAITRESSTSTFPAGVQVRRPDIESRASLAAALAGVDMFVITLPFGASMELQVRLIDAAADAGVRYVLPNEFGSDTAHPAIEEVPINGIKRQARDAVAARGMKWIALVCNPWFEYSLQGGHFGIDPKNKTARLWGDGTRQARISGMANVGVAVARVAALPVASASGPSLAKYANAHVYTSNLLVSQNDLLASVQRVTGTAPAEWTVSYSPVEQAIAEGKAKVGGGDFSGLLPWLFGAMFSQGRSGQYEGREVANETLGLVPADIDSLTKSVLDGMKARGEL